MMRQSGLTYGQLANTYDAKAVFYPIRENSPSHEKHRALPELLKALRQYSPNHSSNSERREPFLIIDDLPNSLTSG